MTSFCTHSSMNFCVFFLSPDDLKSFASTALCVLTCLSALASSTHSKMKPKRSSHLHNGRALGAQQARQRRQQRQRSAAWRARRRRGQGWRRGGGAAAARGGALQLVLLGDCHERLDCLGGLVALDGLLNLEADGALLELELVQLLLAVAVAVGLLHLRASIKLGVRIQSTSPLPAAGALAGCTGVAEHDGGGRAWLQASSCSSEPQP